MVLSMQAQASHYEQVLLLYSCLQALLFYCCPIHMSFLAMFSSVIQKHIL